MNPVNILIAEHEELEQLLLKTQLNDFGLQCELASNGQEAMQKVDSMHFDLVMLSLQLPVLNGFQVSTHIRDVLCSEIPIVATCALITPEVIDKCTNAGINEIIAKPVAEAVLLEKMNALLYPFVINHAFKSAQAISYCKQTRFTDLSFIIERTKSNPQLIRQLISLYIKHTPKLIDDMKLAICKEDWEQLNAAAHKMIPSFSILGLNKKFEMMARDIQHYGGDAARRCKVEEQVAELDLLCTCIYAELEKELNFLKGTPE